jgi:hypothetical protein
VLICRFGRSIISEAREKSLFSVYDKVSYLFRVSCPLNNLCIAETRDFNRLNEATLNARQLYDAMLELYPDRVNPGSLWGAANTAKKQA